MPLRRIAIGKRGKAADPKKSQGKSIKFPGPSGVSQTTLEEIYVRPETIDRDMFPNRSSVHIRSPWIVSTKQWLRQGRFISLFVNPSETTWQMPRRETMVKTKAGLVRNVWRNRFRRSYYDEFSINITFQAGNIMPGQPYGPFESIETRMAVPSVPNGLGNFYDFLEMLDQTALIGAEENRHIIYYRSRIFPQMYMEGYFSPEPLSFTDSSVNGNTVQWTQTFNVYRTSPRINNADDMNRVYWSWVRERAAGEIFSQRDTTEVRREHERAEKLPETVELAPRAGPFAEGIGPSLALPAGEFSDLLGRS